MQIFWNTVGKGENVSQPAIFSFSYIVFSSLQKNFPPFSSYLKLSFANSLTFSQISSGFTCLLYKCLKTQWEKEKLLVLNNFSFSYIVFYPSIELSAIFIKSNIVICKLFNSFPNKPLFLHACNADFLKTLWEKEKSLVKGKSLGKGREYYHQFCLFPCFQKATLSG